MKKFKMAIAALMLMTLAAMNVGCDDQMPAVGPNGNPNSSYNDDPPYDPPYDPQMLYVDLGLPSGTLWTYHNIGASDDYSYGQPFAWGEIETKSTFTWYTYKWSSNPNLGKGMYNLTKYCRQSSYGYNGYVDNLTTLEPSDDAAHYKCGSVYSIPTPEDWEELFANTDQEWIKKFGKSGMLFTSKNNGEEFFIPATGFIDPFNDNGEGTTIQGRNVRGLYWTNTLSSTESIRAVAYEISGRTDGFIYHERYDGDRCCGYFIRPVVHP